MATVKYTGARYITEFADPIEWQADTAYEQIVACQYNGSTYISKQPVPRGIGNPAANPDYWLLWADPNAQMEELRQIVNGFDNDISTLKNTSDTLAQKTDILEDNVTSLSNSQTKSFKQCNIAFIGDSWTVGYNGGTSYYGYVDSIIDKNIFKNVYRYQQGGAGYIKDVNGITFNTLANNLINEHPNDIDIIVIIGGVNDHNSEYVGVGSAVRALCSKLKTQYPNSKIYVGCNLMMEPTRDEIKILDKIPYNATMSGCIGIPNLHSYLFGLNYFTSDKYHLTAEGYVFFANCILNALNGIDFPMIEKVFYISNLITVGENTSINQAYIKRNGWNIEYYIAGDVTDDYIANQPVFNLANGTAGLLAVNDRIDSNTRYVQQFVGDLYTIVFTRYTPNTKNVEITVKPKFSGNFAWDFRANLDVRSRSAFISI